MSSGARAREHHAGEGRKLQDLGSFYLPNPIPDDVETYTIHHDGCFWGLGVFCETYDVETYTIHHAGEGRELRDLGRR
jgi:hypothetical protein